MSTSDIKQEALGHLLQVKSSAKERAMAKFKSGDRVTVSPEATTAPADALGKTGTVVTSSRLPVGSFFQRGEGETESQERVIYYCEIDLDDDDTSILVQESDLSPA
jgi:hypothetical protein